MNRLLFLIICCFSAIILAQNPNWTSVKETNINVSSALSFDIFTNQDGNHIIVQESNNLKYYKMNLNGQAGSPITLESNSVVSPSITGDRMRLYVVYRRSSETTIRAKYSTNGGSTWLSLSNTLTNQSASSIESVMSNNNIHITFQVGSSVYYSRKYALDGTAWTTPFTVSNTETASSPRIAAWTSANEDKVYFIYKNSTTTGRFREYNITNNQWSSIHTGYSLSPSNLFDSNPCGFTVASDYVYYFYSFITYTPFEYYFQYRILTKNGGLISTSFAEPDNQTNKIFTTTTYDGNSHSAFYFQYYNLEGFEPGLYRHRNFSTQFYAFDQIYWNEFQEPVYYPPVNLSSAGNEVHIIWKDNLGLNAGNNLRYKFDNQDPIAPQNLTITSHNNHPKLVWQKNPELDIDYYRIYKKKGTPDFEPYATVSASLLSEYVDNEETLLTGPPQANETVAKYVVSANDLTNPTRESAFSNEVQARVPGDPPQKIGFGNSSEMVYNYELGQNYPNPFNPSTVINYQIKDKGFVSLKIYDMLGKEIAELVNETQESGEYSVNFNASSLPSGVYIYSLRVNDFVQNHKMTLLK